MNKPILLDIMEGGRFVCQLLYDRRGFPEMINGRIKEVHSQEDIERFVYEKRPGLKGKNINIEFSNQRINNKR